MAETLLTPEHTNEDLIDLYAHERPADLPAWVEEITLIPGMPDNFFNTAAFPTVDGTMLVGRLISAGAEEGMPDIGQLVGIRIRDEQAEEPIVLWEPEPVPLAELESFDEEGNSQAPFRRPLIEDPRAYVDPDGRITFDVTMLHWNGKEYKPFPAYTDPVTQDELSAGIFPPAHYYDGNDPTNSQAVPGKNATRVTDRLRVFRPDSDHHGLRVFQTRDDGSLEYARDEHFKSIPEWGKHKMGTTAPPFWFAEDSGSRYGIMMIHGIKMEDKRYIYYLGASLVEQKAEEDTFSIIGATRDALSSDHFDDYFSEDVQLHPDIRDALYMTGAIGVHNDDVLTHIEGYVNVGDTRTVKVRFSVEDMLSSAVVWRP